MPLDCRPGLGWAHWHESTPGLGSWAPAGWPGDLRNERCAVRSSAQILCSSGGWAGGSKCRGQGMRAAPACGTRPRHPRPTRRRRSDARPLTGFQQPFLPRPAGGAARGGTGSGPAGGAVRGRRAGRLGRRDSKAGQQSRRTAAQGTATGRSGGRTGARAVRCSARTRCRTVALPPCARAVLPRAPGKRRLRRTSAVEPLSAPFPAQLGMSRESGVRRQP